MKKWLAFALALMMALTCIPAMTLAEDVKTLRGWGAFTFNDQTGLTSYSQQYAWQEVENRLGIKVDWETVSASDKQTKFSLMMAGGNLPDIIMDMDPLTWEEFGRMGALIALNDYINEEKMPNLTRIIAEDPAVLASITSADGNIYFFPRVMPAPTRYWEGTFIRQDYLDKVGMQVPTTTDELYTVLKAIKDQIPECTAPAAMNMASVKTLVWAWGVGSRGTGLTTPDDAYINDNDEIAYGPIQDEYRDALRFINKLYEEGLLTPDWNSIGGNDIRTNIVTGVSAMCNGSFSGVMSTYNSLLIADGQGEQLVPVLPLIGPNGKQAWQGHNTSIDVSYGITISSACADVDTAVALIDYLYSDEGRELIYWGVEGKTFTKDAEGHYSFTEEVTSSELGTLIYLNNYSANTSCYPTQMITEFYHATLSEKAAEGNLATTAIGEANDIRMPSMRYTEDEIAEVNAICVDLNAYVDEHFSLFVNGELDVDDDAVWQTYIDGFDGLRLDELLGYHTTAYARWKAAAGL